MPASRSVVSVPLRTLGDVSLHLKAGPAAAVLGWQNQPGGVPCIQSHQPRPRLLC